MLSSKNEKSIVDSKSNAVLFDSAVLTFVVDGTGSMEKSIKAVQNAISKIFGLAALTGSFSKINLIFYRDYCDSPVIQTCTGSLKELDAFLQKQSATGGGDHPEASTTALSHFVNLQNEPNIIFWYTDAPPHSSKTKGSNFEQEQKWLGKRQFPTTWKEMITYVRKTSRNTHFYSFLTNESPFEFHSELPGFVWEMGNNSQKIYDLTLHTVMALIGENKHNLIMPIVQNHTLNNLWKIGQDEEFTQKIYDIYTFIFETGNLEGILIDPIFGRAWRRICCLKKEPYKKRTDTIMDLFKKVCSTFKHSSPEVNERLKEWIEETYIQRDMVEKKLNKVPLEKRWPAVVINADMERIASVSKVMELNRALTSESMKLCIEILANAQIIENESQLSRKGYAIPLALPNPDFFGLLVSLIVPGMIFGKRASIMLAAVAYRTGNPIFKDRAREFIMESKGEWFDWEDSANFSYNFFRLIFIILNTELDLVTPEDKQKLLPLFYLGNYFHNTQTLVQVLSPFTPEQTIMDDYLVWCDKCNKQRSFTMVDVHQNQIQCAICICDIETFNNDDPKQACWVECRICGVNYTVYRPWLLNVIPKCHFCRENISCHKVSCTMCRRSFIDQTGKFGSKFVCPPCSTGKFCEPVATNFTIGHFVKDIIEVPQFFGTMGIHCPNPENGYFQNRYLVKKLMTELVSEISQTKIGDVVCISGSWNEWNSETAIPMITSKNQFPIWTAQIDLPPGSYEYKFIVKRGKDIVGWLPEGENLKLDVEGLAPLNPLDFLFKHKTIINFDEIIKKIQVLILSGNINQFTCMICFEDWPIGRRGVGCSNQICHQNNDICWNCANAWYGAPKVGQIIPTAHLSCPFCRTIPNPKVIPNKQVRRLVSYARKHPFEDRMHYAWCSKCQCPVSYANFDCHQEQIPETIHFICPECQTNIKCMKCPSCQVVTEKTSGCDHLTCPCGAHWCYRCGQELEEQSVHDHLQECTVSEKEGKEEEY